MNKIKIFKEALIGEWIKRIGQYFLINPEIGLNKTPRKRKVIVSLTSYGRRAEKIVATTIISLLQQSYKPDRIILWLDSENWNEENLSQQLKKLKDHGVEVMFCEDIKSYKKLIPTLELAGEEDYIVTVDDDQYYPKDFLKGLVEAMDADPNSTHAYQVHNIKFKDGKLLPYNEWELCTPQIESGAFFPTGVGGIIYKKSFFISDITNKELYMSLAPKADDIWFFFMAFLSGVKCHPVKLSSPLKPIDLFYQKLHANSSLRDTNWGESMNDKQMRAVMAHYNITDKNLHDKTLI